MSCSSQLKPKRPDTAASLRRLKKTSPPRSPKVPSKGPKFCSPSPEMAMSPNIIAI